MCILEQYREVELEPQMVNYAIGKIKEVGCVIDFQGEKHIEFKYKGSKITFFPCSGWATGATINDGRGLYRLLNQLS